MRTSHPDETQLVFLVFDLLYQDRVDLRVCRYPSASAICTGSVLNQSRPFLRQVQTFPDGAVLLEHWFEGVVSKRLSSRYASGPSRNWTKTKCPDWKRDNAERYRVFEHPKKNPPSVKKKRR